MQNIGIITIFCIVICRALQARVSRQVMMNVEEDDSDDGSKEPERVSLADLKHRGKKKAIAPINRAGSAIKSKRVNIQIKSVVKFSADVTSSPARLNISIIVQKKCLILNFAYRYFWRPAVTRRPCPRQCFKQSVGGLWWEQGSKCRPFRAEVGVVGGSSHFQGEGEREEAWKMVWC